MLRDAVRAVAAAVGERLHAVYALGSLAHGGFSPQVSDVDIAVILTDPSQQSDRGTILDVTNQIHGMGSTLHSRVSIFWGTPSFLRTGAGDGRFPPLDRLCLFQHGRLLTGDDIRGGLPGPSRQELVTAGAQFALDLLADNVNTVAADPPKLLNEGTRRTTKTVLFPVRFLFTAETGNEGTNDAAVEHYCAAHRGPAAELVRAAFEWRTSTPDPRVAAALLSAGFVPLYDGYLADHVDRLQAIGATELADRFRQWRARLPAAG